MNSNDTIIAFANVWIFYTVLKYFELQENKEKKNKLVIITGLLLGLGLGVRYSFLITLIPILIFLLIEIFYLKIFIRPKFIKKIFFIDLIKVILIAYFFMVLFWPETHSNILLLPIKIFLEGELLWVFVLYSNKFSIKFFWVSCFPSLVGVRLSLLIELELELKFR